MDTNNYFIYLEVEVLHGWDSLTDWRHTEVVAQFIADMGVEISLIVYHFCLAGAVTLLSVELVVPEIETRAQ